MAQLYVARRSPRKGLYLKGENGNQSLLFFLPKADRSHLDQLIRSQLEKQGITNESAVQSVVDRAEAEYERRIKIDEAKKEIRRLMQLKLEGATLIQNGYRKWVPAFYMSNGRSTPALNNK